MMDLPSNSVSKAVRRKKYKPGRSIVIGQLIYEEGRQKK